MQGADLLAIDPDVAQAITEASPGTAWVRRYAGLMAVLDALSMVIGGIAAELIRYGGLGHSSAVSSAQFG